MREYIAAWDKCFFYLRRNKLSMWIVFCAVSLLYIFDVIGSVNLFAPYPCGGFRPYRLGMCLCIPKKQLTK